MTEIAWGDNVVPLPSADSSRLSSGGGGGTSGGMEARVARLEADVSHMKADLSELRSDMKVVRDLATRIDAKLDAKAEAASVAGLIGEMKDKPGTWRTILIVLCIGGLLIAGREPLMKAGAWAASKVPTTQSAP